MEQATLNPIETASTNLVDVDKEIARLLKEVELNQKQIAKLRLSKPEETVQDYTFTGTSNEKVRLSELFGNKSELIVIHNMGRKCVYCTLWADSLIGLTKHIEDRAAFVLTSPDDPETQRKFAADRGWTFRTLSTQGTSFKADMGFEPKPGEVWPGFSTFRKDPDGSIKLLASAHFGPGDPYCGFWHYLDLLPPKEDWDVKYHYDTKK